MGGWGGIVASAALGGIAGAADEGRNQIIEQQKEEAQKLRDERLAQLTRGNQESMARFNQTLTNENASTVAANEATAARLKQEALDPGIEKSRNAESKRRIDEANAKNLVVGREQSVIAPDGSVIIEGRERVLTQEEKAKLEAETRLANSRSREADAAAEKKSAEAAAGPKDKPLGKGDMTNFKPVPGSASMQYDDTTGYSRKWVKGQKANPGSSGFLGIGATEASPAVEEGYVYFGPDKKPVTIDEVLSHYPKQEKARTPTSGPISVPSRPASASAAPAGYRYIGKSPDGRSVYDGPNGRVVK